MHILLQHPPRSPAHIPLVDACSCLFGLVASEASSSLSLRHAVAAAPHREAVRIGTQLVLPCHLVLTAKHGSLFGQPTEGMEMAGKSRMTAFVVVLIDVVAARYRMETLMVEALRRLLLAVSCDLYLFCAGCDGWRTKLSHRITLVGNINIKETSMEPNIHRDNATDIAAQIEQTTVVERVVAGQAQKIYKESRRRGCGCLQGTR